LQAPASLADPVYFPGTGSYYEVVDIGVGWNAAQEAAENVEPFLGRPGRLVTISSAAENAFVADLIRGATRHAFSIGAFQPEGACEPGCDWQWITGEPWSYTNWNAGEPNNTQGIEDVVAMYSRPEESRGKWNDAGFVKPHRHLGK